MSKDSAQAVLDGSKFVVVDGSKGNPHITVQYLEDFFKALPVTLEGAAATRMAVFLKSLVQVDVQSLKTVLKDYASKERHGKAGILGQWETSRTRAKEIRQIYGATRFAGLDVASKGWHTAYDESRHILNLKGLQWDGSPALTDEQVERRKGSARERSKAEMVKQLAQDIANAGGVPDYAKIAESAGAELDAKKARGIAFNIVKTYGTTVAGMVVAQMAAITEICKGFGDLKDVSATDIEDALTKLQNAQAVAVQQ